MTVGESVIQWLYGFGDIEASERIETDQLGGEAGSYGLYKQPTKDVTDFIDGSRDVTEYYYLLAREASGADASRVANQAWMDALEAWVREQSRAGTLPQLDGGRTCNGVAVSVSAYMSDAAESGTAEYQITVSINYTEV